MEYKAKIESVSHKLYGSLEKNDLAAVKQLIEELEIVCPISGSRNWTEVRQFNLMFATQMVSAPSAVEPICVANIRLN